MLSLQYPNSMHVLREAQRHRFCAATGTNLCTHPAALHVAHVYWLVFLFRSREALAKAVSDVREQFGVEPRYWVHGRGEIGTIYITESYTLAVDLYDYVKEKYYLELSDLVFMMLERATPPWVGKAWEA